MSEEVPLLAAAGVAALQCGCGALVAVVTRRAADGRLGRNHLFGIRIGATMRSDAAWRGGHAAAVPLSDLAGLTFAVSGLAALTTRETHVFGALLAGGAVLATAVLLLGVRRAAQAASAAD